MFAAIMCAVLAQNSSGLKSSVLLRETTTTISGTRSTQYQLERNGNWFIYEIDEAGYIQRTAFGTLQRSQLDAIQHKIDFNRVEEVPKKMGEKNCTGSGAHEVLLKIGRSAVYCYGNYHPRIDVSFSQNVTDVLRKYPDSNMMLRIATVADGIVDNIEIDKERIEKANRFGAKK